VLKDKINNIMTKQNIVYSWDDYKGIIYWSRVFKTWKWSFNSINDDYTDEASHIDVDYDTIKDAEDGMFIEIEKRVGILPKRKC
jgi:hypothetical protein